MDERLYWLWLQQGFGAGSSKPATVLRRMKTVQAFYEAGPGFWQECKYVTSREFHALRAFTLEKAEALLEYCEKLGQRVLTPADEDYPQCLRELPDFPAALYMRGTLPAVDQILSIAVVGSRKADEEALNTARQISHDLAACGAVIVSGGAVGVDAASHQGALQAGGKTVCVLPCGLDHPYLMDQAMMRERIAENGALLSEYPENTGVFRGNFTVRNRLISGLAHGTLVVSAAKKSGTLITAARAVEQNRDVFVFPGPEGDERYEGARALLDDGAAAVCSAADILREYEGRLDLMQEAEPLPLQEEKAEREEKPAVLGPEEKKILPEEGFSLKTGQNHLDELSDDAVTLLKVLLLQDQHINELTLKAGLPARRVLAALTELELAGMCESHAGRMYCRRERF